MILLVLPASWAVCEDYYGHVDADELEAFEQHPSVTTPPSTLCTPVCEQDMPYATCPLRLPQTSVQGFFAQVDYFYWDESDRDGPIKESGPLVTLGYQARKSDKRYRLAMFFGNVNYEADVLSDEILGEAASDSDYLGAVFEYDFRWKFARRPTDGIFAGIGTRFWSRNVNVSWDTVGDFSIDMREFWWTVYPRVGLDIHRTFANGWHLYSSGSLGFTAYTYEKFNGRAYFFGEKMIDDSMTLEPKCGLYGRVELSLRKNRLFLSLMLEQFGWGSVANEDNLGQPDTYMLTAGLLTGFVF